MNSTEIFTLALGLKDPWEITDIKITDNEGQIKELHLEIGFKRGSKFKDSHDQLCPIHTPWKRNSDIWTFLNTQALFIAKYPE